MQRHYNGTTRKLKASSRAKQLGRSYVNSKSDGKCTRSVSLVVANRSRNRAGLIPNAHFRVLR